MRRGLWAVTAMLLLTASLAGCLERRGTLAVELVVSDGGAIDEFRSINLTFEKVRIKARTLNPEDQEATTDRVELVEAAASGRPVPMFAGEVRSDTYQRVTLIPPTGATFRGYLVDGTQVGVVVEALAIETDFEVPRGGSVTFEFAVRVEKSLGTGDVPTYRVAAAPEESGTR
ncbi:MAG TPA: hypothetical protein VGR28_02315 [Candidatus Thermoplasmatota archaeon]|jgi:hypothetical protein|nr:hypothetical protein [Candidatus Thermoplasmatota archaeon]